MKVSMCEATVQSRSCAYGSVPCWLPLARGCQEKPLLCSRHWAQGLAWVLWAHLVLCCLAGHESMALLQPSLPLRYQPSLHSFPEEKASSAPFVKTDVLMRALPSKWHRGVEEQPQWGGPGVWPPCYDFKRFLILYFLC